MNTYAKYFAECMGTFGLTLAVIGSLGGGSALATPVIAAITVCIFVYSMGHISGTHLNPAVTLGLFSLGKINFKDTAAYIVSQFIGAVVALYIGREMVQGVAPNVVGSFVVVVSSFAVFMAELIGTFFFTFGIAAVVYGRVPAQMNGVVVGGSLLLGISLASLISKGILNPAVLLGLGSFSWPYLLGPIAGSILGMWTFKFLSAEGRV